MNIVQKNGNVVYFDGEVRSLSGEVLHSGDPDYSRRNPHSRFAEAQGVPGGSDGAGRPDEMIDAYQRLGYTILALTDHNRVTWPWSAYGRDPGELGMLAVKGSEPSRHHHMGSYFCAYDGKDGNFENSLTAVAGQNGLAVIFHPGRYSQEDDWYVERIRRFDHVVGIEIYNQGDRYPGDRALWDRLLVRLMPDRPLWAYANDDAHNARSHVGRNWQVFLLPELSEVALMEAMRRGHFYLCHAPLGGDPAPVLQMVHVDKNAGVVSLKVQGWTTIYWLHNGKKLETEGALITVNDLRGVLRAVIKGPTGRTYTQPFFIDNPAVQKHAQ